MIKIQRVVSVDPGLNNTGFGILDYKGSQIKVVAYGLVTPPAKESIPNRLEYLNSHMNDFCLLYTSDAAEDTINGLCTKKSKTISYW